MGTEDSFPGVKRLVREANHSLSSSADVRNAWSYISAPPQVFMAWRLVTHRDVLNFGYELSITERRD